MTIACTRTARNGCRRFDGGVGGTVCKRQLIIALTRALATLGKALGAGGTGGANIINYVTKIRRIAVAVVPAWLARRVGSRGRHEGRTPLGAIARCCYLCTLCTRGTHAIDMAKL